MIAKRKLSRLVLAALCAGLSVGPAFGLRFSSVDPRLGVVYVPTPSLLGTDGHPAGDSPVLTNFLGVGTTMELGGLFGWEPSLLAWEPALDIYWAYHLWSPNNNRALPAEIASRTSFTLAFLLQSPLVLTIPLAADWDLGIGLGPAFNMRAGMLASMSAADAELAKADIPKINGWFWGEGRWFQPETFLRIAYRLTERVDFSFAALGFWPLSNLWTHAAMPLDEGIFGGEIRVKAAL